MTNTFRLRGKRLYAQQLTSHFYRSHGSIKTLIDWPGNSPDLNPIENVWAATWLKMSLQPGNFPRYIRDFSLLYEGTKFPLIYRGLLPSI